MVTLALGCATPASEGDSSGSETLAASESDTLSETESAESAESESESAESETGDTEGDPPRPARLLATADWRAKRVSLIDYAALRDGAETRDAALWKVLPLPDHEPGPLERRPV